MRALVESPDLAPGHGVAGAHPGHSLQEHEIARAASARQHERRRPVHLRRALDAPAILAGVQVNAGGERIVLILDQGDRRFPHDDR